MTPGPQYRNSSRWHAHKAPEPIPPDSWTRDLTLVVLSILLIVIIAVVAQLLNPVPL